MIATSVFVLIGIPVVCHRTNAWFVRAGSPFMAAPHASAGPRQSLTQPDHSGWIQDCVAQTRPMRSRAADIADAPVRTEFQKVQRGTYI